MSSSEAISVYTALGQLVRRYRGGMSQGTLAALVSKEAGRTVGQSAISSLELGNRWGDNLDLIGAFARVLDIPAELVQEAMGLPTPGGKKAVVRPTLPELVERDPSLSKTAKAHLINQYGLLQLASKNEVAADGRPRRRKTG